MDYLVLLEYLQVYPRLRRLPRQSIAPMVPKWMASTILSVLDANYLEFIPLAATELQGFQRQTSIIDGQGVFQRVSK